MKMTPSIRKFVLTGHIGVSVGLLGAIAGFLALSMLGFFSRDAATVRAAYFAMEVIALFIVVPFAVTALLTGFIECLCTPWGLLRHYWVVAKLFLTGFATVILLVKLQLISYTSQLASSSSFASDALRSAGIELMVHAAGGLVILFVPLVLSVYKPWGMTAYGARMRRAQFTNTIVERNSSSISAWRHASSPLAVAATLILIFLLLHVAASHFSDHAR